MTDLGRLHDIAGEDQPLNGRVLAEPATVIVVCRNGQPERVLEAGKGYWRGLRMPLLGTLTGFPVSLQTRVVEVTVTNVATNSPFSIPSVTAQFGVRLRREPGWQRLLDFARENHRNFGEQLEPRVRSELDRLVRLSLRDLSYDEIYASTLSDHFPLAVELLDGLVELEQVLWAEAEHNASYEKIAAARAQTLADLSDVQSRSILTQAEQRARLVELPGQHQIELEEQNARLELTAREAAAMGFSPAELAHPDVVAGRRDAELEQLRIAQEDRRIGADILKTYIEKSRTVSPEAFGQIFSQFSPVPRGPKGDAKDAPPLGLAHGGSGRSGADLTTPELWSEGELEAAWEELGVHRLVAGSALARHDEGAAVLVVVRDMEPFDKQRREVGATVRDLVGRQAGVTVIELDRRLPGLVTRYMHKRLSGTDAEDLMWRVRVERNCMQLACSGDGAMQTRVRRLVNSPEELIMQPLRRLLPYSEVAITSSSSFDSDD